MAITFTYPTEEENRIFFEKIEQEKQRKNKIQEIYQEVKNQPAGTWLAIEFTELSRTDNLPSIIRKYAEENYPEFSWQIKRRGNVIHVGKYTR